MTIKQSEAVKAYKSIKDLNQQKLSSPKLAKQIYDLTKKLSSMYDFQVQEEQKILSDYPEFDLSLNGIRLSNKSDEEKEKAIAKIKEIEQKFSDLADIENEIDFEKFTIILDDNPDLKLSGEDIGNLEPFIEFK